MATGGPYMSDAVFVFNRTHEPVTVDVEGEAIAASLAHVDDGRATIDPTGVVVLRR